MAISNRFQGYPAFNNKDIVPTGYIDSIVSRQFTDNEPKGIYTVELTTPMVTVYGKSVNSGLVKYRADLEDLAGTNNQDDPSDPYRYKKYFIFVDYEYFGINGAALGKYNTVKFVVNIVEAPLRKKPDTLTEKWILPDEVAEYIITPTAVSGIKEEDIPKVVGVDYFSIYFTSKRERLLPASTLGININYSYLLSLSYPSASSDFGILGMQAASVGSPEAMANANIVALSSPVVYKWGLQLMNAKTVVNKEISITQSIIDSKGTIGGLQYFHIPLEQSDQGIYKILCVSKEKVEFSDSDLKVLGKGFIPPGDPANPGSDPTDPRDGIDSQKLTDAEPFAFGICQNRELKKKYKSGSSNRDFPQSEIRGISLQGYMINSPLFVANEDSVTDGFYLVTTSANPIEVGKSIYITYGLVEDHELRHVVQSRSQYLGATPITVPSTAQYEFRKFKFRVLKTHLEKNIFLSGITGSNVPGSATFTPGEIPGLDFSGRVNTNFTANHSNYISDINRLKLPEESRPVQLLDNFYSYRITRSKVASIFFQLDNPTNGYYVANAIGIIDSGGNIYAPGIYHIDAYGQPKLLFPASSIRNQEWWNSSFSNSGYYNISSAMQPSQREFLYDVGDFTNSYIPDDRKIPYDRKFGLALSELSKTSKLDPRVATSGVGICCLDFINLNALNSRVNGSSVLFNPASIPDDFNLINAGYIDLSESVFDTSTTTSTQWTWNTIKGTAGNPAYFDTSLGYFFYKPINFNKNGRIFWEGIGPGDPQLFMINVLTTPTSSYFSGSFETTQMENGMVLSASDDDNSLRWYGVESSIAIRPKGDSLKSRSSFPDSSFMGSPSFNSRLDEVGNYKWLPVDSIPFYTKGRNILASYQINPLSSHVNTVISNAQIQIESIKKVSRTYMSGYEANEININQTQEIETEIQLNFSNDSVIQIDAEIMISNFPEDILISYVHFFIDNDESKILFIPVYRFNKNYIRFSFFANMATGTCRIVIPFDVNVGSTNIKYKYINNTDSAVKYRENILKSNNSDVFFNKDGSIYILFTDIEDESLDLCSLNKNGSSRIIRSLFQSINDEKISFLSCRTSSKDSSLIVMFQINECILIKTIYLNDIINSEFDLMPPINNPSSYAFADMKESSGNSIKVLSLNPKMYAKLQKQISGIDIKNEIMANKERSNSAYFVHGDLTSQYSRNIYIEGNASVPLQSRQSSFNLLLLNGESTNISLNYLLDDNECFSCRVKDCSSYAKYNKLNNTEKFSFEISDDGSIILFFVKDGNVFIKKGGAKSSFYDIFHGSVKFKDTLYDDYGLIAMRPIKYLIDNLGSTYTEENGIISITNIGVCPEIESVSSVFAPKQNILYVFYVVNGCIIYQYFDILLHNTKEFINYMFTDNSGCIDNDGKQISLINFRDSVIKEKSVFSCKNLPVYLCGTLDSELKEAFKKDLENGVSGYSNFKKRKSYIINPYKPLDIDNFNYPISPISPVSLVQRDGSVRVYVKDENGYLRGFSINGYSVIPDNFINTL